MNIQVIEELRCYIDPLTSDEYAALERSLLAEGCRDALVLWGAVLVDGHNRYAICQKHGIPFTTLQHAGLQSMDDVRLWMIENHLGRRSVSDFQRGVLALRKREILQARQAAQLSSDAGALDAPSGVPAPVLTHQALARAARVSSNTLGQIEKIQKTAAPELIQAVKTGAVSINAAAAVASLSLPRQLAAVAEGPKALRLRAREIRQAQAAAGAPILSEAAGAAGDAARAVALDAVSDYPAELARLRRLLATLTEERDRLKKKVMHLTVALAEVRGGR